MRFAVLGMCVLALSGCGPAKQRPLAWETVAVKSAPVAIDPVAAKEQFGALKFRGGLALTSPSRSFGGWSGLVVRPDGRLIAVSDAGFWLQAALQIDPDTGRLTGLDGAQIAAIRSDEGRILETKKQTDAEDVALLADGRLAVSFEQQHRIAFYDLEREGVAAPASAGPKLSGAHGMYGNQGLEGLTALPDGRLFAVAEFAPNLRGVPFWLLDPAAEKPTPPQGFTHRPEGFGIAAVAYAPNGDIIELERFLVPVVGVRLRVRAVPPQDYLNGKFDGQILADLESPLAVDNFGGVAALEGRDGDVRLYLISDDNFSGDRRTLLYAFDWTPDPRPVAPLADRLEMAAIEPLPARLSQLAPLTIAPPPPPAAAPKPRKVAGPPL